jgi:hypothetical protein
MYKFLLIALTLLMSCSIFSCASDSNSPKKEEITGTWVFLKGSLNGDERANDMFKGFEIVFTPEGIMQSAILEQLNMPKELPFAIKGDMIIPQGAETKFRIATLEAKLLTLEFSVSQDGTTFDLVMTFERK